MAAVSCDPCLPLPSPSADGGEYNYEHINHSLSVLDVIIDRYQQEPVIWGLEPLNEPWYCTPSEPLKQFYWDGYQKVSGLRDHRLSHHCSHPMPSSLITALTPCHPRARTR